MNTSADLLKELRIDRSAPPPTGPSAPRRWLWWVLGLLALLVLAIVAGIFFSRGKPVVVETAPVVAIG